MLAASLAIASAVALAACGGDASSPGGPSGPLTFKNPVGSYDAATINAKNLPVAIFSGDNYSYEVTSGSLSLTADGKFLLKETFRQTVAGAVSDFVDSTYGSWVLSGNTVNFTSAQDGSADKADWSTSGALTFVEAEGTASNTYVYKIKSK
jgi:hypothetical protein